MSGWCKRPTHATAQVASSTNASPTTIRTPKPRGPDVSARTSFVIVFALGARSTPSSGVARAS
jgi:hypothetical protein